jgi:hypothetical protein
LEKLLEISAKNDEVVAAPVSERLVDLVVPVPFRIPAAASAPSLGVAALPVTSRAAARKELFQKRLQQRRNDDGRQSPPVVSSSSQAPRLREVVPRWQPPQVVWESDVCAAPTLVRGASSSGCPELLTPIDVAAPAVVTPAILLGSAVVLFGLKTSALNGKFGMVLSIVGDRAGVLINDRSMPISVKFENLHIVVPSGREESEPSWHGDDEDPAFAEAVAEEMVNFRNVRVSFREPADAESKTTTTRTDAAVSAGTAWSEARPRSSGVPGMEELC